MGLFDLPAPLFGLIDGVLAMALSPLLRLVIWGVLAGWITMLVYRLLSKQERISALKALQKNQQKAIAEFDGEFAQLLPLIRQTLGLGFKQLGLTLGPALLATVPVLFVLIWVAGEFGHTRPAAGSEVVLSVEPANSDIHWSPASSARADESGWVVRWPAQGQSLTMSDSHQPLLALPLKNDIPIIHKKRWWNLLVANPLGYLPEEGAVDIVHIGLPEAVIIAAGPAWVRGWMFSFFLAFIVSSIGFKFLLRLD